MSRVVALVASLSLLGGCFGYNRHAKGWAYVGDTVLVLAGGGAIAADQTSSSTPCTTASAGCQTYSPPIGGGTIVGAVLVTAGLVGYIINATRPNLKTSR